MQALKDAVNKFSFVTDSFLIQIIQYIFWDGIINR